MINGTGTAVSYYQGATTIYGGIVGIGQGTTTYGGIIGIGQNSIYGDIAGFNQGTTIYGDIVVDTGQDIVYEIARKSFMYWMPTATRFEEAKSTRHSIDAFALLRENWDGYGASPISDQARENAHHFIDVIEAAPFGMSAPEVSPQPSGTISFEWEMPYAEVYLEIGNTLYSGFIKTEDEEPLFLQGYADSMDQQIVALIQNAIAGPSAYSVPTITEIRTAPQWHDLLAA
jgi:hypothetical protein